MCFGLTAKRLPNEDSLVQIVSDAQDSLEYVRRHGQGGELDWLDQHPFVLDCPILLPFPCPVPLRAA